MVSPHSGTTLRYNERTRNQMSRLQEVRIQYTAMHESAPESLRMMYQGVLLGLELAAGAIAQDRAEEQELKLQALQSTLDAVSSNQPNWRRASTLGARTKDMEQPVEVYSLTDPRTDVVFYVGSASSAVDQVRDYTRTPNAKVSCKSILDELADNGLEPEVSILESGIRMGDAPAVKSKWQEALTKAGAKLTNQR